MAKFKKDLACYFTEDELKEIAKEMAFSEQRQSDLEQQLKESTAQKKADIEVEKSKQKDAAKKIRLGYEYRAVECEVLYHTPEEGKKTIIRCDTKETESVCNMTSDELQDLFINQIGAKIVDHRFIFRNKSSCAMATGDEFKNLTQKAKFKKITDGYTEQKLVDYKPADINLTLIVQHPGDEYEVWEFASAKAAADFTVGESKQEAEAPKDENKDAEK